MEARSTDETEHVESGEGRSTAGALTLRVQAVMPARRPRVFAFLTEPWEVARWWGPAGFTVSSMDSDPSVGGRYRIAMQPPDGEGFHLEGEFLEIEEPALVAYTFRWEPPDPDDVETVATLRLGELGDATDLTLEQGPFSTEARRSLHEQGWTESFEKLRKLLQG
jgi:uncharacterized protein YndB with AHSA1/START domain